MLALGSATIWDPRPVWGIGVEFDTAFVGGAALNSFFGTFKVVGASGGSLEWSRNFIEACFAGLDGARVELECDPVDEEECVKGLVARGLLELGRATNETGSTSSTEEERSSHINGLEVDIVILLGRLTG